MKCETPWCNNEITHNKNSKFCSLKCRRKNSRKKREQAKRFSGYDISAYDDNHHCIHTNWQQLAKAANITPSGFADFMDNLVIEGVVKSWKIDKPTQQLQIIISKHVELFFELERDTQWHYKKHS